VTRLLSDFYCTVREGLAEKAGPILFQLPATTVYSPEKLQLIIACVDKSFQNVVEFRHASWWKKKVFEELAENDISFCGASFPGLPEEPVINHPVVYYRFHGMPVLYRSSYSTRKIKTVAETISRKKRPRSVFIYFNNTATAAALNNATYLDRLVEKGLL
jgi:uncharacterized protein YecE (DUF72 family)